MSLDGAFLHQLAHEIEKNALGARIDRIAQPGREEIILLLRWRGGAAKLLISANADSPRVHFTEDAPENPKVPPMLCMLLRKHLSGAKLVGVRQLGLDRVLYLDFEATNELGDPVSISIIIEIMGRHSNIIIVGQDGRVLDSVKRVDFETSSVRQILPGMLYSSPPTQDKLNMLEIPAKQILERVRQGRDIELSKALMEALTGVSPILCREIAAYTTHGMETAVSQMEENHWSRLLFKLEQVAELLEKHEGNPVMVQDLNGRPRDFSFMPITQYGASMLTVEYESYSQLLDAFYVKRDRMERMRQRSSDLLKLLANTSDRIGRKLAAQHEELHTCAQRDELRIKGDLLTANLHTIENGGSRVRLQNFYDPDEAEMDIDLDIQLTPAQNAQRYYAQYRKADTAERMLKKLLVQGEEELVYIDSVFDALTRASTEAELEAIRRELEGGGYARRTVAGRKPVKEQKLAPLRYHSKDGFTILVGRNNIQNDQLTLKQSNGNDIWLHTQKIPGSHTIIVADSKRDIPKSTIEQACIVAAYHSKARDSAKVPVDFALVRHVKKPNGAKPGMVTYTNFQTVIVNPDEELVQSMAGDPPS